MRSSADVTKDIEACVQSQAEASSNAKRFRGATKTLGGNAANFFRAKSKADSEEQRFTVLKERETELRAELVEVLHREACEAHDLDIAAQEKKTQALAKRLEPEFRRHAEGLTALLREVEEDDQAIARLRYRTQELKSGRALLGAEQRVRKRVGLNSSRLCDAVIPSWNPEGGNLWHSSIWVRR